MLDELFQRSVPFVATVGIAVGDAGGGAGRAHLANHDAVRNHVGTMHGAAAFAVAETAAGAALVGVLGERFVGTPERRGVRAVVADADITYWRPVRDDVVATATIDDLPDDPAVADALIARRNVSVTVRLDDADGQAVGRAAFHWVVTP